MKIRTISQYRAVEVGFDLSRKFKVSLNDALVGDGWAENDLDAEAVVVFWLWRNVGEY